LTENMDNVLTSETELFTINDFCDVLLVTRGEYDSDDNLIYFDYEKKLNVHKLADDFTKCFDLQYPLSLQSILNICKDSGFKVEFSPDNHKARGYNFTYGDAVCICIKKNDSPSGQRHSLLHELYEIIDEKLYSFEAINYARKKNVIEAKADQFSAYVLVPYDTVFEWINTNGLDVFGLKDFLNCSYITALIRLNEVLCDLVDVDTKESTSVIGILYERPYWNGTPSGRTPRLQFKYFTKSRGFSFRLSRDEVKELRFSTKKNKGLTIQGLIKSFSDSDESALLKNMGFFIKGQTLSVDMLIRTVNWHQYKYTSKVLIQIIPTEQPRLRHLADRLNIPQYEIGE
jgi:hypothetical protein